MRHDTDKVEIENINTPGRVERVDRAKYLAMKEALMSALPTTSPGLTVAEVKTAILPLLPQDCFLQGPRPGGGSKPRNWTWKPRDSSSGRTPSRCA